MTMTSNGKDGRCGPARTVAGRANNGVRTAGLLRPLGPRSKDETTLGRVLIDEYLPVWHKRERHRRSATADAEALLRAVETLTWDEVAAFRALMRFRAGGRRVGGATILAGMVRMGFVELTRGPREIVYGGIGRPWILRSGGPVPLTRADPLTSFVDFNRPGYAKMAFNFAVDGGALSTETRVFLTDTRARRSFGAYWLMIRPFSGLIRREWLAGIVRRAAHSGSASRG
jgi:hypothetical protein